jgi:hypothetical protein
MWADWITLGVIGTGICLLINFGIPSAPAKQRYINHLETELHKHRQGEAQSTVYKQKQIMTILVIGIFALLALIVIRL